jgi:hypothetical protein
VQAGEGDGPTCSANDNPALGGRLNDKVSNRGFTDRPTCSGREPCERIRQVRGKLRFADGGRNSAIVIHRALRRRSEDATVFRAESIARPIEERRAERCVLALGAYDSSEDRARERSSPRLAR